MLLGLLKQDHGELEKARMEVTRNAYRTLVDKSVGKVHFEVK
jgi:hypothetical protein